MAGSDPKVLLGKEGVNAFDLLRTFGYSLNMAVVTVPKVLREKLSDEGADALVELINKADEKGKQDVVVFVEEKFERRLTEVKAELQIEIGKVRNEISEVKAALEVKIESVKADIIKWMFIFWIGQFAAIVGTLTAILFAFFRK